MAGYSIAIEGVDLLAIAHKKNGDQKILFRGKEYLWHYLSFANDQGQYSKIQEFSFQRGQKDAYDKVREELDLSQEQEAILDELLEEGTEFIRFYEVDYSNFD